MAFHGHYPQDMTYEQQQQQQQMMSNNSTAFRALRPPEDPLAGNLPSASTVGRPHSAGPSSVISSSWLQSLHHQANVGSFLHEPRGTEDGKPPPQLQPTEVMGEATWRHERCKADVAGHPLFEQLLAAHIACLRVATPVDQLPRIDEQLAQSHEITAKYSAVAAAGGNPIDGKELDQFMAHYVLLLCSFKEQLQQHVRIHAMEAVMACWEIEQSLQNLTGASPGEGTGATMSDDDEDQMETDVNLFDGSFDGPESMGFGLPTESERCLMERVRQELKHELKQGYKEKLVDIREEILRKRRAGKLPGDSTSLLKAWWQSHSKWPYPTEEDKARLMQETGLQLKQINNWFINQRKRNWHSNPSTSSTASKSKLKR